MKAKKGKKTGKKVAKTAKKAVKKAAPKKAALAEGQQPNEVSNFQIYDW